MIRARTFALSFALVAGFAPALRAAETVDRLTRVVPIAAGTPIRVDATIAAVSLTGSSRSDVRIEIVRHASSAEGLRRFPATIDARPDGVHVAVVQADESRSAELKAEIAIEAPADVIVALRVFEGRVRLAGLRAGCNVDLRRGAIEASKLAGRIRLEAGIGSVDVRDSDLTSGGMMRLRLFNGPLHVRFARTPDNARVLALVFNGALTSDIPLTRKDRFGPRFGETTLGTGDPVLSMDVVKGDIAITVDRSGATSGASRSRRRTGPAAPRG